MTDRTRLRFISEIAGLVAVVASLGFVGMEIRQNTLAVRSATTQAVSDQAMEFTMAMATDEYLPRLISELLNGSPHSDFDLNGIQRLDPVVTAGLRRQENLYAQVQSGILDPAALRSVSFDFYQNAYVREVWALARDTYNPEFAGYWDEVLAEQ